VEVDRRLLEADDIPGILTPEQGCAPGVVGIERSVVMLSDGVGGVDQDASRTVFARST